MFILCFTPTVIVASMKEEGKTQERKKFKTPLLDIY